MKKLAVLLAIALLPFSACNMMQKEKDEGSEVKVSFDQVPPAVRATFQQEAPGTTIAQVDKATENGKTTYEADAMIGGQNYEIIVSEDGKLVSKKVDDEAAEKKGEQKDEKK